MAPFSFSGDRSRSKKPSVKGSSPRKPSDRKPSDRKPSDRKPSDRRRGSDRPQRPSSSRPHDHRTDPRVPRDFTQGDEERRIRSFETPPVPADITGEELEKKIVYQLASLTPGNAKTVSRHLVALERFIEEDPARAHMHGKEISFRAGRLAIVRERAGVAALRAGFYKEALKDLRAAARIGGSIELDPFIAQCEASLGNARKALEIAGAIEEAKLSKAGRVEMRIAAAMARKKLGQDDAALLTLKCTELNTSDAPWSKRLHNAYRDALLRVGRDTEAKQFEARFPESFTEPN